MNENTFAILAKKNFIEHIKRLSYLHDCRDIWRDFVKLYAISISNCLDKGNYEKRETEYSKIIKKYDKNEQRLFAELAADTVVSLDNEPNQDFLGSIFMELGLGSKLNGQFFTPYEISQLMCEIALGDISKKVFENGYITVDDPTCGAGSNLIAAANYAKKRLAEDGLNFQNHMLFVAQDIDETAALMCYIQLSLLGVAGYVKVGDSLTNPIHIGDDSSYIWLTPMYHSNVWLIRRLLNRGKFDI